MALVLWVLSAETCLNQVTLSTSSIPQSILIRDKKKIEDLELISIYFTREIYSEYESDTIKRTFSSNKSFFYLPQHIKGYAFMVKSLH